MSEPENCRRCGLPMPRSRYLLRLEDQGPAPKKLELRLCDKCLDSLHRWITRRQRDADRPGGGVQDVFDAEFNAEPRAASSSRRESARGDGHRGRYVSELERAESFIRLKIAGTVGLIVLAALGLTAVALITMIRKR